MRNGEILEVGNEHTVELSRLHKALRCIEDALDETGVSDLRAEIAGGRLIVENTAGLREILSDWDCGYPVEYGDPVGSYRRLYNRSLDLYVKGLRPYLRQWIHETFNNGFEYYGIVGETGEAYVLRSMQRGKVVLPRLRHVFAAHTHPEEHANPSPRDLSTILEELSIGVLGHCVESLIDGLCIIRVKPVGLDEYIEALKALRKGEWAFFSKAGFIRLARVM
ncbi:hypothetical protein [Desulfurococcus mucosus]|uniref:Uncharacterized protein n=1 Tax=Desulfurococcus mucosus (strain ATCC 35584 / DSM 2162 / JCM 9187 / O7/1) TaxID=765177 RepID=E8R8J2_DESM0|nr:hypothetical protein [Desulfurococcus mucosus]ADV64818.1 hypothetical protein Desmu_0505 [Desulfurococcus mucosus DSM 2162]